MREDTMRAAAYAPPPATMHPTRARRLLRSQSTPAEPTHAGSHLTQKRMRARAIRLAFCDELVDAQTSKHPLFRISRLGASPGFSQ